jgi:mRNA interferase MazF
LERFVKGDVVVVPFPFSDLTEAKRRPALVLVELDGEDRILCQITSQQFEDRYAVALNEFDFEEGSLRKISNIRPIVANDLYITHVIDFFEYHPFYPFLV